MAKALAPVDIKSQPGFRATAYACIFVLYAPILVVMVFSFNAGDRIMRWEGFGFNAYSKAFGDAGFHSAAINTMIIAISATVISTALATIAASGMTRVKPWRGMSSAFMVINLPLMVPEIITAVAKLSFFALLAGAVGLNFGIGNLI